MLPLQFSCFLLAPGRLAASLGASAESMRLGYCPGAAKGARAIFPKYFLSPRFKGHLSIDLNGATLGARLYGDKEGIGQDHMHHNLAKNSLCTNFWMGWFTSCKGCQHMNFVNNFRVSMALPRSPS